MARLVHNPPPPRRPVAPPLRRATRTCAQSTDNVRTKFSCSFRLSLLGKLSFLSTAMFGRVGRAANAPLRLAAADFAFGWTAIANCLRFFLQLLDTVRPRTIPVRMPSPTGFDLYGDRTAMNIAGEKELANSVTKHEYRALRCALPYIECGLRVLTDVSAYKGGALLRTARRLSGENQIALRPPALNPPPPYSNAPPVPPPPAARPPCARQPWKRAPRARWTG